MEKVLPKLRFPEFNYSWELKNLEKIAKRGTGHTPDKKHNEYYNGGIKWISLADSNKLDNGKIYKTKINISELGIKNSSAVIHPENTVLLSRDAGVGKSAIMSENMAVSQHFVTWFGNKNELDNYFLYYKLQILKPIFEKIAVGNTIKTIGMPFFKNLKITIPKYSEQQKIASFLTSIDERLSLLAQQKEKLELYKKGVMQQIFSQKLRFKDENGKNYPDWEEKNFNEIIDRTSTGLNPRQNFTLGKGNNYYVTIKNISNGKLDFRSCEMIDDDALKLIKKRSDLSKNDIIMSSIGNIGEAYLLKEEPTNWNINESVFMIRSKKEVVMPLFMYYILSNDYTKRYFENNMTGSSFKSIKIGDLKLMPVEVPCLEEQQKIALFLSAIDVQIEGVSKKIEQTKLFKKGLLQQMFV